MKYWDGIKDDLQKRYKITQKEERDVEEAVDRGDADYQLPLRCAQVINSATVLHSQHSQAEHLASIKRVSAIILHLT